MSLKEIIFYGDDAFFYEFPDNVKIYYAKDPISPIEDKEKAILNAIDNPINHDKLEALVNKNSRIAICFDDVSVPLPLAKKDVRAIAIKVVIEKLIKIGVKKENITLICATGLHRKCKPKELKKLLGNKIIKMFKDHIFNHDASDENNLIILGNTEEGFEIELNKLAVESDLIIYINITFTPLNGGWKSIIVGLGTYKTIIPHHSPEVLKEGAFMDPSNSGLHEVIWKMGRTIKDKIKVFTVEMVLNNSFYKGFFKKIYSPMKDASKKVPFWRRVALSLLRMMPAGIKASFRKKMKAGYDLIGVFAGEIEKTHKSTLKLVKQQLNVPIEKQYDAIIFGVPNVSPYNVNSTLNPLLLHGLVLGYLYNLYEGMSPLKKDGIIIISNPAKEKFDKKQHPSYIDFYYDILSKKPDIFNLKEIENEYLQNETYLEKYRYHYAYHGTHALMIYYWGVLGLLNTNKIIVAGAKNDNVLKTLGFEKAKNLDDAITKVLEYKGKDCSIAYFCIPPIFVAELKK
ncbi:MAG: lactate racemase domain-containing protein [Promethearchaeota archaeon]